MQKQINEIENKVGKIEVHVKNIKDSQEEQKKDFKVFIKDAPKMFASKLSEKIVYGLVGIIIIAVATALVASVVSAFEYIIL